MKGNCHPLRNKAIFTCLFWNTINIGLTLQDGIIAEINTNSTNLPQFSWIFQIYPTAKVSQNFFHSSYYNKVIKTKRFGPNLRKLCISTCQIGLSVVLDCAWLLLSTWQNVLGGTSLTLPITREPFPITLLYLLKIWWKLTCLSHTYGLV